MAESKSKQQEQKPTSEATIGVDLAVGEDKTATVVVVEDNRTLPQVIGEATTTILTALQSTDSAVKQAAVSSARSSLRIWYEAQPLTDRKELAKSVRKTGENFKSVAEQVWADIVSLCMQDL